MAGSRRKKRRWQQGRARGEGMEHGEAAESEESDRIARRGRRRKKEKKEEKKAGVSKAKGGGEGMVG